MKRLVSIIILSLVIISPLSAQNTDTNLPDLYGPIDFQWLHMDPLMTGDAYKQASRYNKRLLRSAVKHYLESTFLSLGVSENTLKLTGAALGFAIMRGAKINLNDSKTMALELQDVDDDNRTILYKYQFSW